MYRYWFEGGEVYDKGNIISEDEVWVLCRHCPWERHKHEGEGKDNEFNKGLINCHNCGNSDIYPTSKRKERRGKSFIDGKNLGRTESGKCDGEQCTSNKPPIFTIPETGVQLCEECKELFDVDGRGTIDNYGKFFAQILGLLCINDCGVTIYIQCEKKGICKRPPRNDFVCEKDGFTILERESRAKSCLERQKERFEKLSELSRSRNDLTPETLKALDRLSKKFGKPINNDNSRERERERERESKIAQLKSEIKQLEQIANRTPEQEAELTSKKQELAELEREKQQGGNIKPANWTPLIIGGSIVLVLAIIGLVIYFWWNGNKNNKK